jgi:hypothetical protein
MYTTLFVCVHPTVRLFLWRHCVQKGVRSLSLAVQQLLSSALRRAVPRTAKWAVYSLCRYAATQLVRVCTFNARVLRSACQRAGFPTLYVQYHVWFQWTMFTQCVITLPRFQALCENTDVLQQPNGSSVQATSLCCRYRGPLGGENSSETSSWPSPSFYAQIKNEWGFTSTSQYAFTAC